MIENEKQRVAVATPQAPPPETFLTQVIRSAKAAGETVTSATVTVDMRTGAMTVHMDFLVILPPGISPATACAGSA